MTRRLIPILCAVLALAAAAAAQQPAAPAPRGAGEGGPPPGRGGTPPPSPQAIERAAQILCEARTAMGGDKLTGIQTIVATGRTQRVRGNNLVPIEFEIAIELPDKYVRKDEVPAEESGPTATGFAGDELIQVGAVACPGARPGCSHSKSPAASCATARRSCFPAPARTALRRG